MKIAPLKGKTAFASTMRTGKRFTSHTITAIVTFRMSSEHRGIPAAGDAGSTIILGVSIRKKTAKKSTVRNRAKRLLRQSVRMVMREFSDAGIFAEGCPFDKIIVFSNSAPPVASLLHLENILGDVRAVLQAAYDYSQKYSLAQ
ncbi:MAG: ribonuclease P protein component [Candidatus Kapaibacterium sp.]